VSIASFFWGGRFEGVDLGAGWELSWDCLWAEFKSAKVIHFKIGIQVHEMKKHETN
jgi:hypothetical protein